MTIEPADFCITGTALTLNGHELRRDFSRDECAAYALQAPTYTPTGSMRDQDGYASTSAIVWPRYCAAPGTWG